MNIVQAAENVGTRFPGFRYGVFSIEGGEMDMSLYRDIGSNESANVLASRSSSLSDKVAFYVIGRDLALGLDQAQQLPDAVKEIATAVYQDCQKRFKEGPWQGHWHKGAVLIELEATIPGNPRPGSDYVAGRIFQNIEGFTEDNSDVVATPETVEERLWLPYGSGSFALPTIGQNTRYGIPQATEEDLDKAIQAWLQADLGLTEEQAKGEASRFYKGDRGLFAVRSGAYGGSGPLDVILVNRPWDRSSVFGSFPLSRSASRTYTEAEYRRIVEELDSLKKTLRHLSEF